MARSYTLAPAASRLIKTGGGNARSFKLKNVSSTTKDIYLIDGTTAAGTIIEGPFPVGAGIVIAVDLQVTPQSQLPDFAAGLVVAASSTLDGTFTLSGSADMAGLTVEHS